MSFYILILFTISYFLHLTSRIPALGSLRFDMILYAILLFFSILSSTNKVTSSKIKIPATTQLRFFVLFVILTIPLAKWPGSIIRTNLINFIKVVVFYYYSVSLINTRKQLMIFLFVFVLCQIFRGLEPAYLHLTQGYWGSVAFSTVGGGLYSLDRLSGAPHDIVNPNQLAWVINTSIPFIYFLGVNSKKKTLKYPSIVILITLIYPLVLTGSRSGLISMLLIVIIISFGQQKNIFKGLIFATTLSMITGIIILSSQPSLIERYRSIYDSSAIGADTAHGRITGLIEEFSSINNRYLFTGHGVGTSLEVNQYYFGSNQPAHNLYIEVLQELGLIGLILFLYYIRSLFIEVNYIIKSQDDFLSKIGKSCKTWMIMDLIYSFSCFGVNSWEWYLIGGIISKSYFFAVASTSKPDFSKNLISEQIGLGCPVHQQSRDLTNHEP